MTDAANRKSGVSIAGGSELFGSRPEKQSYSINLKYQQLDESGQSYEGDSLDQSHKEIKERGSFARERKSTIEQHNASIKNQGREVLLLGES